MLCGGFLTLIKPWGIGCTRKSTTTTTTTTTTKRTVAMSDGIST